MIEALVVVAVVVVVWRKSSMKYLLSWLEKKAGSVNTVPYTVWCWVDGSWMKMVEIK